jgi:hypothetical protein
MAVCAGHDVCVVVYAVLTPSYGRLEGLSLWAILTVTLYMCDLTCDL